ncbi:MAG: OadG family protein [Bacteroidales bacterium]|nr:OadG family protein [Bacteroidales bacterium]
MELLSVLLRHDPWVYTKGWIVTVAGFLIVIIALFILSYIFRGVAAYFTKKDERKANPKAIEKPIEKPMVKAANGEIAPEVLTAIGMALYLSTNLHDEESNVITIERHQTSWNDKNYGVRHWKR